MAGERVEMPLGEICQVKQGKYLAPGQMSELRTPETPVPVYGAGGILGYTDQVMFDEPVALVTCRGSNCGMLQRTEGRAWVSNNAMACPPKTPNKNRFVYYLLLASKFSDVTTGSAQPQITATHLNAKLLTIATDPNEQQSIAAVLGSLDDKIELNRRMNETLEALAQSLFKSWFVDATQSALPKGWRESTIGELCEFAYGKALKAETRRAGSIPVYGSNGQVGWHDEVLVKGPGIVVGRKGNPGIVIWSPTDFFPIDTTFYIVPKGEYRSLYFLFHALRAHDLASLGADSAVPGLNRNMAYMSKQVLPPSDVQEAFDKQARPLFERVHHNNEESRTLAALRDALLPKLLSGELRVPETQTKLL